MSELTDAIEYVKRMADYEEEEGSPSRAKAMRLVAEAAENPLGSPAMELVFKLQQVSSNDSAFLTSALLDGYRRDAERGKAELFLVRLAISNLIGGKYMPTSHAIADALYPGEEAIDNLHELHAEKGKEA